MEYAPIVIPTLNRIEHLRRCIDSLAKCPEAIETELYLGIDYPPSEKYYSGYEKVLKYAENEIKGFKNVVIIKREKNIGALENTWSLRRYVYEKYDRCIFTEDDNEFASCFLTYMNEALKLYKDVEDVFAVYSARPNVKNLHLIENNAFLTTYYSAYGAGFWREKEQCLKKILNRDYIEEVCCSKNKLKKLKKIYPNAVTFLCSALLRKEAVYCRPDGTVPFIDTIKMIYAVVEDKYIVCSPIAMVKNWGYDGSGVNCKSKTSVGIGDVHLEFAENNRVTFESPIRKLQLNQPLKKDRIIPYISALVRIYIWRIIAKRKLHE